jgi:carbonic anhydrase
MSSSEVVAQTSRIHRISGVPDRPLPLHAAIEKSGGNYAKAISINARVQADLLRTSSTVIREADKASKIKVAYGVYNLASGKVTFA